MIKKMNSKWLSLATASILGQAPSALFSGFFPTQLYFIKVLSRFGVTPQRGVSILPSDT
jgi:hypothetical protein